MTSEKKITVRVVREGHGANCSSIGSVIDTLFVAQVGAGAIFAAVAAALGAAAKNKSDRGSSASESVGESVSDDESVGGVSGARAEAWGAWVRIDSPPALVAIDHDGVRALQIETQRADGPLEAHVAVTSQCGVGCEGCYLDARPDGSHVPRERLESTFDELARAGAFTVAFGGGEPILRDDLDELARAARARGLYPVVTTSGIGMTRERARALREFSQVNVSYDGPSDVYRGVRGFPGAASAERAMELLAEAGVPFGVNIVLTRDSFSALEDTIARARSFGAREAQLLRYKPAGRAARLDYVSKRLTREQVASLGETLERISCKLHTFDPGNPVRFRLRIDCAMVALLSDALYDRGPELAALGVFGCEAGAALGAIRADGRRAPCSFVEPGEMAAHGAFAPCDTCALRDVCRGGCKAVARFVDRADGPDPECPRVMRAREALGARA